MAEGTRTESRTWGGSHEPEGGSLSLGINLIRSLLSTRAQRPAAARGAPGVVVGRRVLPSQSGRQAGRPAVCVKAGGCQTEEEEARKKAASNGIY